MARTVTLSAADVGAAEHVLAVLDQAAQEVDDLRERCLRKDDRDRAQALKIAGFRVERAREIVEEAFR